VQPFAPEVRRQFHLGNTEAFNWQFNQNGDLILELEPGTNIQDLLMRLPAIGDPKNWSDLFLHVFVNHKVVGFDQVLEDQDILDIHIPLSGG